MSDLIDRQAAIDGILAYMPPEPRRGASTAEQAVNQISFSIWRTAISCAESYVRTMPSAQPEQPPYVAEIEAEYQKAVKMPHIHKPLAKALYEVWKKHDREDAERRTDMRGEQDG